MTIAFYKAELVIVSLRCKDKFLNASNTLGLRTWHDPLMIQR